MGNASSKIQDNLRYSVYRHRGLCTDLWDAGATDGGLETPFDGGEVETVAWDHAWGGMLRGFEDVSFSLFTLPHTLMPLAADVLQQRRFDCLKCTRRRIDTLYTLFSHPAAERTYIKLNSSELFQL